MRIPVQKTLKMYVGGAFVRSESGRTLPITDAQGRTMYLSNASRKDLRDALEKSRAAQPGWAGKTAYNRGQILYRIAEMLEERRGTLPVSDADLDAAIDRAVHHAGWCDKISAILSSLNPVASAYVNYSLVRPLGIVLAAPDPKDGLLGLVEATLVPLVMGDAVTVMCGPERGALAVAWSEVLATSDVPGGVVNILTGEVDEILKQAARHDDLDAFYLAKGALSAERLKDIEVEAARVMRRMLLVNDAQRPCSPVKFQRLAEVQTVWMSTGVGGGSQSAY